MKNLFREKEVLCFALVFMVVSILIVLYSVLSSSRVVIYPDGTLGGKNWVVVFFSAYIIIGTKNIGLLLITTILLHTILGGTIGFLWLKIKQRYGFFSQPIPEGEKKIPAFIFLGQSILFIISFVLTFYWVSGLFDIFREAPPGYIFTVIALLTFGFIGCTLSLLTIVMKRKIQRREKKWVLVARCSSLYLMVLSIPLIVFALIFLQKEQNKLVGVGILLFAVTLLMNAVHSIRFLRKG